MTINTHNRALIAREIALEILELHTRDEIEQFVWPEEASGDTIDRAYSRTDRIVALLDAARAEGPVQAQPAPCKEVCGPHHRYHFCGPTVTLQTIDGDVTLGTGWLAITEEEYRSLSAPVVAPPADEVGRAVALATGLACRLDRKAPSALPLDAQLYREEAIALRLILSHVSRLEGALEIANGQHACCVEGQNRTLADLKLAVEALEKLGDHFKTGWASDCEARHHVIGRAQDIAREALRSIRSPIRGSDLESASQSASPPLRQDTLPDDVATLVVAARIVAFEDQGEEAIRALDVASEAFASRVPWDDEPTDPEHPE